MDPYLNGTTVYHLIGISVHGNPDPNAYYSNTSIGDGKLQTYI